MGLLAGLVCRLPSFLNWAIPAGSARVKTIKQGRWYRHWENSACYASSLLRAGKQNRSIKPDLVSKGHSCRDTGPLAPTLDEWHTGSALVTYFCCIWGQGVWHCSSRLLVTCPFLTFVACWESWRETAVSPDRPHTAEA